MLKGMERWLSMDIYNLLYDVGIWDILDSEEEIEECISDMKVLYAKDVNDFLNEMYEMVGDSEYKLGTILQTVLYLGTDINDINAKTLMNYTKNLIIDNCSYGDDNWEASHGYRYDIDSDDDYLHFNNFELLVDYNALNIDDETIIKVFSNLKEKGYIYVFVSKTPVSEEVRNCVYGVIY